MTVHPLIVADDLRHCENLKAPFPLDEAANTIDLLWATLKEVWDELEYDPSNWNLMRDKVSVIMNPTQETR